jgi:N-acetylglucosamine malate deacetylase 1
MKLDVLAIAVHPDDVELCCAGTLMMEKLSGKKVGIVDLTRGELGTRGTAELRDVESAKAASIMQVDVRENLKMADGFFKNDEEHQRLLIRAIRKYRPEIVMANPLADRHPDHGRAGNLIADACFLSGLRKIEIFNKAGDRNTCSIIFRTGIISLRLCMISRRSLKENWNPSKLILHNFFPRNMIKMSRKLISAHLNF